MNEPSSVLPPLRLVNVHFHHGKNVERVQANISRETFDYFFTHLMAGDRGARQALISTFFQKLYEQCLVDNLEPVWDPSNDVRLALILSRLNFRSESESRPASAEPVRPKRSAGTGRTGSRTSKSKAQPGAVGHDRGPTPRVRTKAPDAGHQPASTDSGVEH